MAQECVNVWERLNAYGGRELLELRVSTHLDAHGGCKLFETRELREKHVRVRDVHEWTRTRVESGDQSINQSNPHKAAHGHKATHGPGEAYPSATSRVANPASRSDAGLGG